MKWKVYEYHWMDHYYDNSWIAPSDISKAKAQIITGVGVKVGQDKEYIYFSCGVQGDGLSLNGVMAVMRKNIVYMKQIGTTDTKQYKT